MVARPKWTLLVATLAGCASVGAQKQFDLEPRALARRNVPLLLVHGALMVGRGVIPGLTSFERVIVRALTDDGFDVWLPALPALSPSAPRAEALLRAIDAVRERTGAARVLIIAHSQGGVDVRVLLADPRSDGKIAAVATLSSPHHGTPLANIALQLHGSFAASFLDRIARRIDESRGWPSREGRLMELARELTPAAMDAFDAEHPTTPVPFFSLAATPEPAKDGSCDGGAWPAPVTKGHRTLVMAIGGEMLDEATTTHVSNDGFTPTRSHRFGTFLGCAPIDHMGWLHAARHGLDVPAVLVELARGLRDVANLGAAAMAPHAAAIGTLVRSTR